MPPFIFALVREYQSNYNEGGLSDGWSLRWKRCEGIRLVLKLYGYEVRFNERTNKPEIYFDKALATQEGIPETMWP